MVAHGLRRDAEAGSDLLVRQAEDEHAYMQSGHVPVAEAGTVLSMISPADELAATDAAIEAAMQAQ